MNITYKYLNRRGLFWNIPCILRRSEQLIGFVRCATLRHGVRLRTEYSQITSDTLTLIVQMGFAKAGQASFKLARRDRRALEVGQTRSYKLERDIRTLSGVLRCENIFS